MGPGMVSPTEHTRRTRTHLYAVQMAERPHRRTVNSSQPVQRESPDHLTHIMLTRPLRLDQCHCLFHNTASHRWWRDTPACLGIGRLLPTNGIYCLHLGRFFFTARPPTRAIDPPGA